MAKKSDKIQQVITREVIMILVWYIATQANSHNAQIIVVEVSLIYLCLHKWSSAELE